MPMINSYYYLVLFLILLKVTLLKEKIPATLNFDILRSS
jgi:hypothetical protein